MNLITSGLNWLERVIEEHQYEGELNCVPVRVVPVASSSSLDAETQLKGNEKAFLLFTADFDPANLRQNMALIVMDKRWKVTRSQAQRTDRFWYYNDPEQRTYTIIVCESPS